MNYDNQFCKEHLEEEERNIKMCNYIFIDESGSIGIKSPDKYFIVSALVFTSSKELEKSKRIIKRVRQTKLKKKGKKDGEVKFSNSNKDIRKKILLDLNKLDVKAFSIILEKKKFFSSIEENPNEINSYLITKLLHFTFEHIKNDSLKIILDRCMNKTQRNKFETLCNTQFFEIFRKLPQIEIVHEDSKQENGLRLVDFVAGSFRYKFDSNNEDKDFYVEIIKDILIEEILEFE